MAEENIFYAVVLDDIQNDIHFHISLIIYKYV